MVRDIKPTPFEHVDNVWKKYEAELTAKGPRVAFFAGHVSALHEMIKGIQAIAVNNGLHLHPKSMTARVVKLIENNIQAAHDRVAASMSAEMAKRCEQCGHEKNVTPVSADGPCYCECHIG